MSNNSDIEIFQSSDGLAEVTVTFDNETVWLNQEQLSQLFERDRTVIGRHIRNIFKGSIIVFFCQKIVIYGLKLNPLLK